MYEKVSDAIILAANAHKGQYGKLIDCPYIFHPLQVASVISTITLDENVIAAGVLHDVIEDAGVTPETIKEQFGEEVYELVLSETENKHPELPKSETWMTRKQESLEVLKNTKNINVKILWLSDKLANIRSYCEYYKEHGDQLWQKFHQTDPAKHKWYYEQIIEYTKELSDTKAYKELVQLFNNLFHGEVK